MINKLIRQTMKYVLTGSKGMVLQDNFPNIREVVSGIEDLGLYLHVPFCRHPCFYCPYFKEKYSRDAALAYRDSVIGEIEFYRDVLGEIPVTSFYIGGGTPTTMMGNGLEDIVHAVRRSFGLQCDISTETHPNDITPGMVEKLKSIGAERISMGIESFGDRFLKILDRPYKSRKAKKAVSLLVDADFKCINIDLMFGLPNQEIKDVEEDIRTAIELDVDQISAYPIFTFPHTGLKDAVRENRYTLPGLLKRRRMLRKIEELCYNAGMERTSVWAFTKKDVEKYSSVTVPRYIGLGAGAGSLVPGFFFINTFSVSEYIKFMAKEGKPPVALAIKFSEAEEMFHWLYWRIYETQVVKGDFEGQFDKNFDATFKKIFSLFGILGMSKDIGDKIVMTDRGNYWVHVLQNLFSLDFIGRVWDVCLSDKWPGQMELI